MKQVIVMLSLIFISFVSRAQKVEPQILLVLDSQSSCWNRGDIEGFMQGYWHSDSLKFIGKSGLRYGWQQTLDAYKKGYPDKAAMGSLHFGIININTVAKGLYQVVGTWQVNSSKGELKGVFSLLFKKIEGKWLIIVDHTS